MRYKAKAWPLPLPPNVDLARVNREKESAFVYLQHEKEAVVYLDEKDGAFGQVHGH